MTAEKKCAHIRICVWIGSALATTAFVCVCLNSFLRDEKLS